MAALMRVPEVAAGATDVVLGEWLAREGADLAAHAPLAVIETDKAQVEVEVESPAVLLRALVPPGAQVAVGAPLALLGTRAELGADLDATLLQLGVETPPAATDRARPDTAAAPDPATASTPEPSDATVSTPGPPDADRRFASPLARRLLRTVGIDIATVTGSGPGGRIIRRDA